MKQCTPIKPHKYDKLEYLCAVQHFNCNIPKIEVEKNVKYLDTITPLNEYDLLGGYERDTIYLVIPHNQEDINCLNIINGYFCQYCEPLFEDEHIGQVILAIIHCNYYSKDITEDCFGVDFNLLSNYTAEVTSELEELNKFATKEITQRAKKYEHSKAQEKVFGLVESYFEECERNGWHDFEMWCEDNIDNDIEKILVKKVANEVTHIGTWLFE
jgi:hypothetical protein